MTEDNAAYDRGRGLDFWARDPVLRAEVARTFPADARAWAEPRLEAFGGLVGGAVDERSAVVDRRFVDATLRSPPDRVVDEDDRLPDAWFDAVVRFAPLDPDELATPAATVD